jgi:hypothetical protein
VHVDISRDTFDADKHFSRVIFQQGRVTLDSEPREQSDILLHQLRTVIADLLGPAACPDAEHGFQVARTETNDLADLSLSAGRMYVEGILVENPESATPVTYWNQPDAYPDPERDQLPEAAYVAYLRVWERGITAIEDPSIREVALGDPGPDTAARAKVIWQLAINPIDADLSAGNAAELFQRFVDSLYQPKGLLRARAKRPPAADLDVCDVSPTASYRGPENQLYRVEIHASGVAGPAAQQQAPARGRRGQFAPPPPVATFKWSRDNGSVASAIVSMSGAQVTLADLGRDSKQRFEVGDWVELVDDASAAAVAEDVTTPAPRLFQITAIDVLERLVTLDTDPAAAAGGGIVTATNPDLHPLLRRWDHTPAAGSNTIPVVEGSWILLEDGVEVMFTPPPASKTPSQYRRGDHWLIPARIIPGDVLWPQDNGPKAMPPHGIRYHYAPLAFVPTGDGDLTDLCQVFKPLFAT